MMNKMAFAVILITCLYTAMFTHPSYALEAFRGICRGGDHSLTGLFASLITQPLDCARRCDELAFCNYWAIRGNECRLGFGIEPCEWGAAPGDMWTTFVKYGTLQTCDCEPDTTPFRDHCYIFPTGIYNWTAAFDTCADLGAGMAEIPDIHVHNFLVTQGNARGYNKIWLGGSDSVLEGTFVWNSGAPFSFTKWSPTEPNNSGNEDHVELYVRNSVWNDHRVWIENPIACQINCI